MDIHSPQLLYSFTSKSPSSNMAANSNQHEFSQHPLEATAAAIAKASNVVTHGDIRASHMMSANEGPMDVIAKVSGAEKGGKREDDAP
jgi:catalase